MSQPFLYVWDVNQLGLPQGIEDISQFLEKVEKASPSSNLKAFIAKIQFMALHDTQLKLEAVSPYLSLLQNTANHQYPVVALEQANVPQAQFLAVLAKIVTIAQQLNIAIYDDNRVMLFLPSGEILPSQRAAWWIGALDYLEDTDSIKDISEVSQEVERLAADMWQRHPDYEVGEIRRRTGDDRGQIYWVATKKTPLGEQRIVFSTIMDRSNFALRSYLVLKKSIINDIYFASNCSHNPNDSKYRVLLLPIIDEDMYKIEIREELITLTDCPAFRHIRDKSQIAKNMMYVEKAAFKFLLPLLENIQSLDQLLNSHMIMKSVMDTYHNSTNYTWLPLIVARLANNPNFDTIAEKLAVPKELAAELSVEKRHKYQQEYHKLLNYLREHVKPLI